MVLRLRRSRRGHKKSEEEALRRVGSLSLCSICRAPFRSVDLLGRKMSKKLGQPARLSSHETSLISPSLLSLGSPFRHFQSRGIYCSRLQPLIPNLRRTDREMGEGERGREGERERGREGEMESISKYQAAEKALHIAKSYPRPKVSHKSEATAEVENPFV